MPKKKIAKKKVTKKEKAEDSNLFAFIATFLSIIGFIIVMLTKKEDKYVMHYAKQSLVLFLAAVIVGIIVGICNMVLIFVPILGWILLFVVNIVYQAGIAILWIISWIQAISGKEKEIPLVGHYARNITF